MEREKILNTLSSIKPTPTLVIAKNICGPKATKKNVNSTLYTLQKEGLIRKISEKSGRNPRWILI